MRPSFCRSTPECTAGRTLADSLAGLERRQHLSRRPFALEGERLRIEASFSFQVLKISGPKISSPKISSPKISIPNISSPHWCFSAQGAALEQCQCGSLRGSVHMITVCIIIILLLLLSLFLISLLSVLLLLLLLSLLYYCYCCACSWEYGYYCP